MSQEGGVRGAFARICALEEERDLLRYEADGWAVWPLIRPRIVRSIARPGLTKNPGMSRRRVWRFVARDLLRLARPRRASMLAMTYVSGLSEREGDRFKDQWFDDLLGRTDSFYKIEGINNPAFLERSARALFPSDLSPAAFHRIAYSVGRSAGLARRLAPLDGLLDALGRELDLSPGKLEEIRLTVAEFLVMKRLYGWLLDRVRPRVVLVADYGEYSLVAAARERGIATVELQHGINDRFHPAYSWTAYAALHRARMPIPERQFLYGEHWRREMAGGDFWGDSLRVVGSPRIDQYRERRSTERADDSLTLTFTAQGLGSEASLTFLAEALRALRSTRPVRLFVKPHPIYDTGSESWWDLFGRDPRVSIVPASESPSTFELLARSDVHLSVASATHYDALGLGVPTVVLPMEHRDVVEGLLHSGDARLARTPAELAAVIEEASAAPVAPEISHCYYRPNALRNMLDELGDAAGGDVSERLARRPR